MSSRAEVQDSGACHLDFFSIVYPKPWRLIIPSMIGVGGRKGKEGRREDGKRVGKKIRRCSRSKRVGEWIGGSEERKEMSKIKNWRVKEWKGKTRWNVGEQIK